MSRIQIVEPLQDNQPSSFHSKIIAREILERETKPINNRNLKWQMWRIEREERA